MSVKELYKLVKCLFAEIEKLKVTTAQVAGGLEDVDLCCEFTRVVTDGLAINLGTDTKFATIDFNGLLSDVDISSYAPTGLVEGARVTFRKLDNSPYKIIFTDEFGVTYSFIDKYSEYITLYWDGTKFFI